MRVPTGFRVFLAAALMLLSVPQAARAALLWNFSYTGTGTDVAGNPAGPVSVAGQLTTTDVLVGGAYTVTGITGTRNGEAITALLPAGSFGGFVNNLLFLAAPFVDNGGIGFAAGGVDYNFYLSIAGTGPCAGVLEISSLNPGTGCSTELPVRLSVTPAQAAVPAPVSLLVFGTALLGLGLARRARQG